jgi:hypothetical protein
VAESSDLSPLEWLERLAPRVLDPVHQDTIAKWRRYYDGDHDLPAGPSQLSDAFRAFQRKARTNLCGICVRSMADRMEVLGYREKDRTANEQVWQLWTKTRLTARQTSIWRKAIALGSAFVVVGPDPNKPGMPRFTIEGPDRIAVETDPGDPLRRLAAVRIWHDPIVKRWLATVYLPRNRYHYQTKDEHTSAWMIGDERESRSSLRLKEDRWIPRDGTDGPMRSTDVVPVIPFYNCDEGDEPLAEFAGEGVDIQDRLNLSILNRLTTERYQAYRQRGLLNFEPDEDPITGKPIPPFRPGSDTIWTIPPANPGEPEPKFVDLPPSDTRNILDAIQADMRAFAASTVTPVYYLPGGDMINLAADAILALDSGHTAKIRQRAGLWTGPVAELTQLAADVAGLSVEVVPEAIAWARPESFHPAAVADYVSKMTAAGVPLPIVAEEIGWSPEQVERLRAEQAAEQMRQATLQRIANPPAASTVPGRGSSGGSGAGGGTGGAARGGAGAAPARPGAARPAPRPAPTARP